MSSSEWTKMIKERTIYANYLGQQTRFNNDVGKPPLTIGGNNSSSAFIDVKVGAVNTTAEEELTIRNTS